MSAPEALARAVLAAGTLAEAQAEARRMLARRLLPLKVAAHELGISTKTARRRAQAGAGILTAKGWIVDLAVAAEMGRRAR